MVVLPLLLAVFLLFGQSNGNPNSVCNGGKKSSYPQCISCNYAPNCKNVTRISTSTSQASNLSPYYTTSLVDLAQYNNENSVCVTLLDAGRGVLLQFRTIVYQNGSLLVRKYLTADVAGSPGKYILVGVTNKNGGGVVVKYEYSINLVKCQNCQVFGYYACTLYKSCTNTVDYFYGYDSLFTLSTCKKPPSSCLNQTEAQLVASNNFNTPGFYNLPFTYPLKCVCSFNGIDVINRNLIANENCVSLP